MSDMIREQFYRHRVSLCVPPGKDVATNVEVYWPDGRSVARPLEPSDINSVLEIRYPKDEDEITPTAEIEVHCFDVVQRDTLQNIRIVFFSDHLKMLQPSPGFYFEEWSPLKCPGGTFDCSQTTDSMKSF